METYRLTELLEEYGVPYLAWGTGASKTFEHLLRELASGESVIQLEKGGLIRKSEGVLVNVYYRITETSVLKLVEEKQVFRDGRIKRRETGGSVGEKLKPSERVRDAFYRALKEELGIDDSQLHFTRTGTVDLGPVPSDSFPGLLSHYIVHTADLYLPRRHFVATGYIERQEDKDSYFVWKKHGARA